MENGTVEVLLVDDDAAVRELLVQIFNGEGFKVTAAGSGLDASRILKCSRPRVLVTDIFMPDMDGLELIGIAREISPTIKTVAISGGHPCFGNFLDTAMLLGADAILGKPFDRLDLLDTVTALLDDE